MNEECMCLRIISIANDGSCDICGKADAIGSEARIRSRQPKRRECTEQNMNILFNRVIKLENDILQLCKNERGD